MGALVIEKSFCWVSQAGSLRASQRDPISPRGRTSFITLSLRVLSPGVLCRLDRTHWNRRFGLGLLFLGFITPSSSLATPYSQKKPSAEGLLFEANRLYQKRNLSKSLEVLSTLKKEFPYSSKLPEARLLEGDILFKNRKYDQAIALYSSILNQYPSIKTSEVALKLAKTYQKKLPRRGDRDLSLSKPALEAFKKALKHSESETERTEAREGIRVIEGLRIQKEFLRTKLYKKQGFYALSLKRLERLIAQYESHPSIPACHPLGLEDSKTKRSFASNLFQRPTGSPIGDPPNIETQ